MQDDTAPPSHGFYQLSYLEAQDVWDVNTAFDPMGALDGSVSAYIQNGVWQYAYIGDTSANDKLDKFNLVQGGFSVTDSDLIAQEFSAPIVQMASFDVDYDGTAIPAYAWVSFDEGVDYDVCIAYKPTAASANYQAECSDIASSVTNHSREQVIGTIDFAASFNEGTGKLKGAVVFGESAEYDNGTPRDIQRLVAYSFTANGAGIESQQSRAIAEKLDASEEAYANPKIALAAGSAEYFISFEETISQQAGLMILDDDLSRLYPSASSSVFAGLVDGNDTYDTARNAKLIRASDGDMVWAIFATKGGNERPVIFRFKYTGADQAGYDLNNFGTLQAFIAASAGYTQNGLDMDFDAYNNMVIAYKESLCTAMNVSDQCSGSYSSNVRVAYYDNESGFLQSTQNILSQKSIDNGASPINIATDNAPLELAVNNEGQTALIFQERREPESGSGQAENTVRIMRLD